MPRQRFIWPSLWEDPDIGRMSFGARILYIACFSNADDEGRLIGEAANLRSIAFRYDDMPADDIRELRDEIAKACRRFQVYEANGITYIAFGNWDEFQKPKYPKVSKYPKPPKASADAESSSGKVGGSLPEDSGNVPEALGETSATGLGRDGLGSNPLTPSPEGEQSLRESGDNPRARGTNPRAVAAHGKREQGFVEYVHRFWDEYPNLGVLVDELTDRGCERVAAQAIVDSELKARPFTEAVGA